MSVITPPSKDFSQWYNDIVLKAGLADYSAVRGCMVIKPYGYSIWENIRDEFDKRFKDTGHQNAYFPLFIPKSFFSKEAKHVEGFAKECAVVTHYRLKNNKETNTIEVDEAAKLEEELIVRPTSETIIWNTYKEWIQSHRDLPILINQWCNIVRWEMRTRMFLRTAEFLWQEGHTAHATRAEAEIETKKILGIYTEVIENILSIPVIQGTKTEAERFAGAIETYCVEALMQDGKALQAGTSHFLGQNFAKAFDVTFTNTNNQLEYVWATSWGVSTRLMGALIMSHSDERGLVLPPKIAPYQVVILPITKKTEALGEKINEFIESLTKQLKDQHITYKLDDSRDNRLGWKINEYELKGVPIRIVVGERDLEKNVVEVHRRDTNEKQLVARDHLVHYLPELVEDIQKQLFIRSKERLDNNMHECSSLEELNRILDEKGGFVSAWFDGSEETEKIIQNATKASARCLPLSHMPDKEGKCFVTGKKTNIKALFARAY